MGMDRNYAPQNRNWINSSLSWSRRHLYGPYTILVISAWSTLSQHFLTEIYSSKKTAIPSCADESRLRYSIPGSIVNFRRCPCYRAVNPHMRSLCCHDHRKSQKSAQGSLSPLQTWLQPIQAAG